ncbi:Rne/Rng family ribonuclease [Erythrobacter sp. T5W1-R]|uniref:Rne/Rng family ribonuclease n=1 Tax=Erythrobacter sp. T5W1-R TaxID=3101752 RepID=UPI002AFEF179|nr:Rne/Rng family ribonuclease [Erythrobacter sp. T5W1-R]MEA1619478.1 Rne/Rng family ribonuclease [Erythrobacter sp. T5W1-R]
MATRMLIDARHPEETRVAVLQGNRIEEFDFESAEHKQIKGNIYLAKVTRVEPSLQAAFVDFGGNRHGFLAFSEIHPDYYQIPKADREALLAEEAEAAEEEERLRAEEEEEGIAPGDEYDAEDDSGEALAEDLAEDGIEEVDTSDKDDVATIEGGAVEDGGSDDEDDDSDTAEGDEGRERGRRGRRRQGKGADKSKNSRSRAKQVDEVRAKRMALRRRYKIQDVIQRRQVLLVQVVKEERGNKGAALTTYLSLAGRYTVLMPNSSHGGGISRKINSTSDRKRLKEIVAEMKLPRSMGLIVRTAGLSRTKPEIRRDFDYLARLWDEIREKTLASVAPALIHSDSDLIKRAIRDIYNKEIEEVVVEGEDGYKSAKAFMKLLMPSHARRVKAYVDPVPLFQRYGAEDQLRAMYDPMVQLKSGGYLIINPTEALVSIDINSGRSTKEHGIEATALHTNLEAAKEIARQLRLRDMAGLVVIDFIDMEYSSNIRKVEKAMKDALKHDRARIQVGRISSFGLMEMSRQRLRTGVLEATTRPCPHCDGTGLVRTASSAGLSALRLIEDEAAKGKGTQIRLAASTEAAIYLLNEKRADLVEIEQRYGVAVEVVPEGENEGAKMTVSSSGPRPSQAPRFDPIIEDEEDDLDLPEEDEDEAEEETRNEPRERGDSDDEGGRRKKRRRRRGGRNRKREDGEGSAGGEDGGTDDAGDDGEGDSESEASGDAASENTGEDGGDRPKKRRRRGGRGRNKRRGDEGEGTGEASTDNDSDANDAEGEAASDAEVTAPATAPAVEVADEPVADEVPAEKPKRKRAPRKPKVAVDTAEAAESVDVAEPSAAAEVVETAEAAEAVEEAPAEKPKRKRAAPRKKAAAAEAADEAISAPVAEEPAAAPTADAAPAAESADAPEDNGGKPRRGWWQRTFGE